MKRTNTGRGMCASLLGALGIGVVACGVCCAPAFVVAIGLLGLTGATGAILGWWLPLIGALMVVAAVLVLVLPKRRERCRPDDRGSPGCGCEPQEETTLDSRSTLAP